MLLDVHTHRLPFVPGESIFNADPSRWKEVPAGHYCSVGIHPWQAAEPTPETWTEMEAAAACSFVLALGETGLDKRTACGLSHQREVFIRHILLAEKVRKPLVIHCVKAFNELVELKRAYRPRMPWVVHGFRNNLHIARRLIEEGIFYSLGEKCQPDVLRETPPERLLAETDESTSDIRIHIARMAQARGTEPSVLCRLLDENARNIFFRS